MKTKNNSRITVNLKLFLVLPVILLVLIALSSCATKKKVAAIQTEIAPPPPPPYNPATKDKIKVVKEDMTDESAETPFVVVEEMPMFPGGDSTLLAYISQNTRYPETAKKNKIQGKVILRFCITAKGTVDRVSVLKGVDPEIDAEAIRVASSLPAFKPGKQGGKPVPVWYMIPVTFTLNGDNSKPKSFYQVIGNDTVYNQTNEMPKYPGGYEALQKFKNENIKYLPEVKSLGIEGTVFVRFRIEKNGSISDVKIMQGVSPSLDAEAIRVAKLMPAWEPGRENGKPVRFLSITNFDFLGTSRTTPEYEEGTPFVVVEEMPMFPGGDSALLAYISHNAKYPEYAKANKVEGKVIVRFCVTDVGGIDRVSILKGVDAELDAEAARVVKTLPAFKPGKQGGKPVNVWYMVPITFGLNNPVDQSGPKAPPPPPPPPAGYDEPPVYKGGEASMIKFINSKLVYPKTAKEKKISGKVNVRFSVDTDGSIGGVSVVNGIDPELNAEAIRVVKLLPAWNPGKLDGKPVKVWYNLPVTFRLE